MQIICNIIYFIVGDFFHHTQSFYGLQNAPTDDKLVSNYAQYAFTGGIQMMSKQRQMKDTLNKAKLALIKTLTIGKNTVTSSVIVLAVTVSLLWISIFLYMSFYSAYVPTIVHDRDVNLQFR